MPVSIRISATEPRQLPALTGLRGFGALWVFLHHQNLFSFGTGGGFHVLAVGFVGVDLFFLLSGFIMAHTKCRQFDGLGFRGYIRFLIERIVRLYPTNLAALGPLALLVWVFPAIKAGLADYSFSAFSFFTNALLIQSWLPFPIGTWIVPNWSVSAEMGAYAALPLLLSISRRIQSRALTAAIPGLLIVMFVAVLLAIGIHDPNVTVRGGLFRIACEFSAGVALYKASRFHQEVPPVAGSVLVLLLLGTAVWSPISEMTFLAIPGFALMIMLAAQERQGIAYIFATRPAIFLGRISYSLYLIHWPVLLVYRGLFSAAPFSSAWLIANVTIVLAVLVLATILHMSVEQPSHRWARALGSSARNMDDDLTTEFVLRG